MNESSSDEARRTSAGSRKLEAVMQPSRDVLFREIEGECVLLDLGSGTYFGLNEVGTRIWNLLREGLPEERIAEIIAAEFDGDAPTIRADVRALLADLESRRLIVSTGDAPA